jgi:hypothetical protein
MASSHPAAAAVSITRPSTHQPTLVYDQKSPAGPAVAAFATSRDSARSSCSIWSAKPNSVPEASGNPERLASRSRSVARPAQPLALSSGT